MSTSTLRRGLVALLVAVQLVVWAPGTPTSAAAELAVSKQGPGSILAGQDARFTLTASNPGDEPSFNLTFRDVLAPGVTYVPGSTQPASALEPSIVVNQVELPPGSLQFVPQQTLIWSNVSDLQPDDEFALTFDVRLNETASVVSPNLPVYVVGSSFDNQGQAFASPDPRRLPGFTSTGQPIADPAIEVASSNTVTTRLSALEIVKSEPSPEGELLRGVHDHVTEYTLQVRVTDQGAVDGVVVTDLLPAELEFLGCDDEDNSSALEYPDAPGLGEGGPIAGCTFPDLVETVENPASDGSTTYPPGIYTKLTWFLLDQPAGAVVTLRYAAAIPLRANELFADPDPAPESGDQASNLDNNTGASTRELVDEGAVTNVARASGVYQGPVEPSTPVAVESDDSVTLTIEDVRMRKSVTPGVFTAGGRATYTLTIDTSEYTSADGIGLTDRIPNGICPLFPGENYALPILGVQPAECEGEAGDQPTVSIDGGPATPISFQSVVEDTDDGGFDVVFGPVPGLAPSSTAVVTYVGRMRTNYAFGDPNGAPPVSGDGFTNSVGLTATTSPIDGTGESGDRTVNDESAAVQGSTSLSLAKTILPRTVGLLDSGDPCPTTGYVDPEQPGVTDEDVQFRLGDRVCFRLRIDFASSIATRNAVVTDFLPVGVEYDPGSAASLGTAPVEFNEAAAAAGDEPPTWRVGVPGVGGNTFVAPGGVFDVVLAGRVVGIPDGNSPEVRGNLMKLRTENTAGQARSFRDQLEFQIVPAAPVGITKGVASVDAPAFTTSQPDQDGIAVVEGSVVTYRIDVSNLGAEANANAYSIRGLDVWDALPEGVTCAHVSNISNLSGDAGGAPTYGVCTDPGHPDHPTFLEAPIRSAIRWQFPVEPGDVDRWAIDDGQTRTLTYQVVIPSPTSFGVTLVNDASVRSYQAFTNELNVGATYFPSDNVDATVGEDDWNAPAATDPSSVMTPSASIDKTGETSIVETGNNLANQAVAGELVTYTYAVDVPANTSVFGGVLSDTFAVPSRVTILDTPAPAWRFYPVAGSATTGTPVDVDDFTLSPTGTLTFPTTYTNDTDDAQRFEVELTIRIRNNFSSGNVDNTARFTSLATDGGAPLPALTAGYRVTVRLLQLGFTKTADVAQVAGGDAVVYTLTVTNANNRAMAHDTWVTDCIPDGLAFDTFLPGSYVLPPSVSVTTLGPVAGGVTANDGTNDYTNACGANETFVAFGLGAVPQNTTTIVRYRATVDLSAVGGDEYTNDADVTAGTLDDDATNPFVTPNPFERTVTVGDDVTVTVPGPAKSKTASPDRAAVGETVEYTIVATLPANTNVFQSAIVDALPPGLDRTSFTYLGSVCLRLTAPVPESCGLAATVMPNRPIVGDDQLIGFLVGDIPADTVDRTLAIRYTARVADVAANQAGVTVRNTANTVWDSTDLPAVPDTPLYDWQQSGTTPVTADVTVLEPAVTLSKVVSDATPEPAQPFTYTVRLENATGDDRAPAHDLTVVDTVPVGVVVDVDTISDGGVYDAPSRTITWTLAGPLATGAASAIELTYEAELAASPTIDSTPLVNTADLTEYFSLPTGSEGRRRYEGGDDQATVTPQFPHLTVVKTVVDAPPAYLEEPVTWQIEVTNDGGGRAFATAVVDTLPPNWTYVAASTTVVGPGGTTNPEPGVSQLPLLPDVQELAWTALGELGPDESLTLTFRAVPTLDVLESPGVGSDRAQLNTALAAAVDRGDHDRNLDGQYEGIDTAATRIDAVDLVIDKFHDDPPVAGAPFDWTIRVTNASTTDTAVGPFTVIDTLPTTPGVDFVSATGTDWSCSESAGTVTCTSDGTLAPGADLPDITIRVDTDADLAVGTEVTNAASVDGRTHETDPSDNDDSDLATVTTAADLSIAKTLGTTLVAGEDATYAIDVTNLGPSVSRANADDPITVTDTLPTGVSFVSASGTGWLCAHDGTFPGGSVTCERPTDLAPGAAPTISVTVSVPASTTGSLVNTAVVSPGTTSDPEPDNDRSTDTTTVGTSADLVLTKTASGPFVAGAPTVFRFEVRNDGPSDAAATVRITDTLPTGLAFASATSVLGDWTCTATVAGFECDLDGDLALDATATVDVTVDTASDVLGEVTNTATVSSPTPDPVAANNDDEAIGTFVGRADLGIVKSRTGTFVAGRPATYEVVVTNAGPSVSRGPITIVDTLPGETSFVSATGTGWSCSHDGAPTGGDVTCSYATDLAAGLPVPMITITTDVATDVVTEIVNDVEITATTTTDPNPDNDRDDDRGTPDTSADLRLEKAATGPLVAGQDVTYRLRVDNDGPSDAGSPVRITDALPAGLTFVSSTSVDGTWSCAADGPDGTSFTCDLSGPLAADDFATVDVVVAVASDVAGTVVNSATVTSPTDDPNPDNNTDEDGSPFDTVADLSIAKSSSGAAVAGESLTWTLVVSNAGPSDSQPTITVTDVLPSGVTFSSASGTGWSCAHDGSPEAGTVTCERDTALVADTDAPAISLVVEVLPDAGPTTLVNDASVDGTTNDPDPDNDGDDDTVTVTDEVDVAIDKSATPDPVRAGEQVTYTLTVVNHGPSTADELVVTDTMPAGLTVASVDGAADGWTCDSRTSVTISCSLATLAPFDADDPSTTVTIVVVADVATDVAAGTVVTNTARVATSSPDTEPANDESTADTTVAAEADLSITKTHPDVTVLAGEPVTFDITVANDGPSDAVAPIRVVDTLPAGLTFQTSSGPWSCSADGQVVTCDLEAASLAADTSAPLLQITVLSDPSLDDGTIVNAAEVSSPTTDPVLSNDATTDDVQIGRSADLSIVKSHDPSTVRIGDELDFALLVTNDGPSDAREVVVTDDVPDGLTLLAATGTGWDCVLVGPTATCALDEALPAGATADPVIVTTRVEITAFPGVVNAASVSTETDDPNPDDDATTDPVVVPRLVDLTIAKTHAGDAAIGDDLVFTLLVGNDGPLDEVEAITVTDVLPNGLSPVSATSADAACTIVGQTVTCTKDDGLAVDDTFTIDVTATVRPNAYPLVVNSASVASPTEDADPDNDTATDEVTVPPLVDLTIEKRHIGAAAVGGTITYEVTVRNVGPTSDPGPVTITDELPTSLLPTSASGAGLDCDVIDQMVTCTTIGPVAVGATLTLTVTAAVLATAFPEVENTATVATTSTETDITNNNATDVAPVSPLIRLGVTKRVVGQQGVTVDWGIRVRNAGLNATIEPIVVTDVLPAPLTLVSTSGDGWECTGTRTVRCTYTATVEPGASTPELRLSTAVAIGTTDDTIVNVATAEGGGPDTESVTSDASVVTPECAAAGPIPPCRLPTTGSHPFGAVRIAGALAGLGLLLWFVTRRRRAVVA